MRRRLTQKPRELRSGGGLEPIHRWVLSLPWVIERPFGCGAPEVRSFAVDCEPLGLRRMWLVTGIRTNTVRESDDVAVILPRPMATAAEHTGSGRVLASMSTDHVLVAPCASSAVIDTQRLILAAYNHAMSSPPR